jgi:crotonobetainyl-CoA:carnitine CoA-transferase CaiB-like acyl-CoA transferase
MLPLDGVLVVSLEQAVAAPFASRQLADLGARVIKIERPGRGDFGRDYDTTIRGMASQFVWLNRSKESLTLDLKQGDAREVLHRLLARADVFLQNLAPGAWERLGFGASVLEQTYPRLIVCNISGYGSTGPYRDRKAYDLLIQNETGLVSLTGTPETPCRVGISIADIATAMYAYSGILSALLLRGRTGQGTAIEVSMFEALGEWVSYAGYYTSYGGRTPARTGAHHAVIAPFGPFESGDGRTLCIGLANDWEWQHFCEIVLQRPELVADPRFTSISCRVVNRAVLDVLVGEVFQALTVEEIIDRLEHAKIGYARTNTMNEFMQHPQLTARERWREVGSPVGPLRMLIPPVGIDGVDPVMGPIPEVGEHTEAILRELGFSAATIEGWRECRLI